VVVGGNTSEIPAAELGLSITVDDAVCDIIAYMDWFSNARTYRQTSVCIYQILDDSALVGVFEHAEVQLAFGDFVL
jgi:hypothetical protein